MHSSILNKNNNNKVLFSGGIYIYGLTDSENSESMYPWYERISPDNEQWYYYRLSNWPECQDMRSEGWRLISLQFVHGKFCSFTPQELQHKLI